jgi:hypothetical protein
MAILTAVIHITLTRIPTIMGILTGGTAAIGTHGGHSTRLSIMPSTTIIMTMTTTVMLTDTMVMTVTAAMDMTAR